MYLFSYRNITKPCPLKWFISQLQVVSPSWRLSIHSLSSSLLRDDVSFFRSFLYLSPQTLSLSLSFLVSTTQFFQSSFTWLFPLFNILVFRLFTTNPNSASLALVRFNYFAQHDYNLLLNVNNAIVDSSFPVPEPSLAYDSSIFDG